MSKYFFSLVFLIAVCSGGCKSDSQDEAASYPVLPIGSTATLNVPGGYNTIQKAVMAAHTGDVIRVAAGVYTENLLIKAKNFGLRGAGKGQTIIQGTIQISENSEISIEGVTVTKGGIRAKNSPVRITGNEVINNPGTGLTLQQCGSVIISDNDIRNNGQEGIVVDESSGIIGNTRVIENATDGIVINNASPTLSGNSIIGNGRDGVSIRGFTYFSAPQLLENTIQGNGGVSNYDIICFGGNTNPTGIGNLFDRCANCTECRNFGNPATYQN